MQSPFYVWIVNIYISIHFVIEGSKKEFAMLRMITKHPNIQPELETCKKEQDKAQSWEHHDSDRCGIVQYKEQITLSNEQMHLVEKNPRILCLAFLKKECLFLCTTMYTIVPFVHYRSQGSQATLSFQSTECMWWSLTKDMIVFVHMGFG